MTRLAVRIVPDRAPGTPILCPRCRRKNGVTIIPGGRHQIVCKRCSAVIDFETWPDEYEPPPPEPAPVTVLRVHAGAPTPADDAGLGTPRPGAALSKG
jgi:hypothetical protein